MLAETAPKTVRCVFDDRTHFAVWVVSQERPVLNECGCNLCPGSAVDKVACYCHADTLADRMDVGKPDTKTGDALPHAPRAGPPGLA